MNQREAKRCAYRIVYGLIDHYLGVGGVYEKGLSEKDAEKVREELDSLMVKYYMLANPKREKPGHG